MAKSAAPALALDLFGEPEPAPVEQLQQASAELREKTERSRALREDLVFENVTTLEWRCGLCSRRNTEIGVLKSKVDDGTAIGDWKGRNCAHCGECQYLLRVGEDISSPDSWRFIVAMPPDDQPQPYEVLDAAADAFALERLKAQWPHAYAFVAQARHYGHTDPSLTPVRVSPAGRREFDLKALAQYANWLLRGVRSDRPLMTPERWGGGDPAGAGDRREVVSKLMQACRDVSSAADAMREKSYHDGKRMGDQITVGQRGIAERIVGDYLSRLASAVAGGESPEAAYARLSESLSQAIERFNVGKEYEVWRSPEVFGQQTLQFAFWKLSEARNA